jgi:hexosaminidase
VDVYVCSSSKVHTIIIYQEHLITFEKRKMKKILTLFVLALPFLTIGQPIGIIPQPVSLQFNDGSFIIDNNTSIQFNKINKDLQATADFFASFVKSVSGISMSINKVKAKTIEFILAKNAEIGSEGYLLKVTPTSVKITANTKAGIIYGMQTIFQTLPAIRTNAALKIPAMQVKDYPRFKWRGMHLDVSRHFFSPELV